MDDARSAAGSLGGNAQDRIADIRTTVSSAGDAAQERARNARAAVSSLGDTAGQQIDQAKQAATQQIDQAKQAASQQMDQAKQGADQGATQAGTQLTGLAGTLRERTRTLDDASPLTTAAAKAADALDGAGTYLQATGPDDWVTDLKHQIERRPLAAVLIAAVIGFLFARTTGGARTIVINRDYPNQAPVTLPPEA